jgi:hypothetical protein
MFEEMLVTVPFYPLLRLQPLPVASTTEATSHCLWTLSVLSLLTCSSAFTLSSIAYFPAKFSSLDEEGVQLIMKDLHRCRGWYFSFREEDRLERSDVRARCK